jgi:NitT/TauT family transport system ATP-binding protein
VGEPWNSVAVERGVGVIVAATARIWSRGVEKLLAMRTATLGERAEEVAILLRALHKAGAAAADPAQRGDVAALLARPEYLDQPADLIERSLANRLVLARGQPAEPLDDFLVLHREAANFPWRSQAMWLYTQMVRWGHAAPDLRDLARAAAVFRPDVYRAVLKDTDAVIPSASAKVEGAISVPTGAGSVSGRLILGPDRFFDGRRFDPDDVETYLEAMLPRE